MQQREEGGRERVEVHVRVPGSYPLPASTSFPPLSLFLWLYDASSTLAAKALMSGAAAGADWTDARVRESGSESSSPVTLATRQATPGREGERSGAQRLSWVPASLRTTAPRPFQGQRCSLLPSLQGSP